ncbi:MAG: SH3 domain-containing protein [Nitrospirota bacterium]
MGDETKVQVREIKKGMEAAGSVLERYLIRFLGPLGRKISESTQTGRIMALVGIATVVVSLVLIAVFALSFRTEVKKGVLTVSKKVVNIRDRASAKGKVVAKAEQGETLSYISSAEGWYNVRATGGTGWVSGDMVERKGNRTVVIEYEMKGFGIAFLAGVGLFVAGILQKKKK